MAFVVVVVFFQTTWRKLFIMSNHVTDEFHISNIQNKAVFWVGTGNNDKLAHKPWTRLIFNRKDSALILQVVKRKKKQKSINHGDGEKFIWIVYDDDGLSNHFFQIFFAWFLEATEQVFDWKRLHIQKSDGANKFTCRVPLHATDSHTILSIAGLWHRKCIPFNTFYTVSLLFASKLLFHRLW